MTEQDSIFEQRSLEFAKKQKKAIARRITDPWPGETNPVSVFMAGSPGAGKTEASKALLQEKGEVLRIDPDDLRAEIPGYQGSNARLVQRAVSVLVECIHDFALRQKQSFLLDGTLSKYDVAEKNVQRSLDKGRFVQILYVYQEPLFAWRFVLARELSEGRNIPPDQFVDQFFKSREVVQDLKVKFKQEVKVDVLLKNIDGSRRMYHANVDLIESHVPQRYTRGQVIDIVRAEMLRVQS